MPPQLAGLKQSLLQLIYTILIYAINFKGYTNDHTSPFHNATGMNGGYRCVLRQYRSDILSDLVEYDGVLETLYQSGIIKERRYVQIKSKANRLDAVQQLLDCIEQAREAGFNAFCAALENDYPWLKDKLLSVSKAPDREESLFKDSVGDLPGTSWLRSIPSEKELLALSKEIYAEDWETLALELGLSLADLEKTKQSTSFLMRVYTMLILWQRREGDNALRGKICVALEQCGMDDILQQWKLSHG